jgi:energy-coupling factor transport system ATP-binding protein
LAEAFKLEDLALTPAQFNQALRRKYILKSVPSLPYQNGHHLLSETVIEFKNVSFTYTGEKEALKNVSLKIKAGEMVAIMGRNGSGKTTLVRHVIGLHQPSKGQVLVNGKDITTTPTHVLAKDVGFCFQNPNHQIVSFTVKEEMLFGLKSHNVDPAEFDKRIRESLEIVDLSDKIDSEVFDLGKGQKQRLALASVLTLKPKILIIDEPTTGQDPEMIDEIFAIIKRLNDMGTTILLITHRVDYAAMFAKRAVVLQHGKVSYDGNVRELLLDHDLMRANSLDLPEVTKLAIQLSDLGVPQWTVSFDEMKEQLEKIIEVQHGN